MAGLLKLFRASLDLFLRTSLVKRSVLFLKQSKLLANQNDLGIKAKATTCEAD